MSRLVATIVADGEAVECSFAEALRCNAEDAEVTAALVGLHAIARQYGAATRELDLGAGGLVVLTVRDLDVVVS